MKNDRIDAKLDTIVGQGTVFEGNISIEGSARVDGKFKGNVNAKGTVVIGKSGKVEGEIIAKSAVIGGEVKGTIRVQDRVEFESGAKFDGEVYCKTLVVQEGVIFDGSCSMTKKEHPQPKQ